MRMTARLMSNAYQTSRGMGMSLLDNARNTSGNCNPIRMKTKPFSRNSTISQTGPPCSRVLKVRISGIRQPRYRPAVTTASTPETPNRSADK